jgi:hypothetical protein
MAITNIPVFFIRDPLRFPGLNHAIEGHSEPSVIASHRVARMRHPPVNFATRCGRNAAIV